ncbi:Invasion protein B family protein [Izhakiella capsodis]|uniref:Invasion protein B family protein n=1 Tax=Izhakiella capsodis TaxID=1367852 RepID=A0A1I5AVH4_9GAMM|nr:hypothetical protein [Izhakiella capsodis]SFN66444.1 Invasion protein B family protein [Izhakiella capsodis]
MKYDIVELISESLKKLGMDNIIDEEISNHSTIALNMKNDIPTIYISNTDDEVWVWAQLMENIPTILSYNSANLIPLIMEHDENYFYVGQPCLYPINGFIELRAQIKDNHLQSADDFLLILDRYLDILQSYRLALV